MSNIAWELFYTSLHMHLPTLTIGMFTCTSLRVQTYSFTTSYAWCLPESAKIRLLMGQDVYTLCSWRRWARITLQSYHKLYDNGSFNCSPACQHKANDQHLHGSGQQSLYACKHAPSQCSLHEPDAQCASKEHQKSVWRMHCTPYITPGDVLMSKLCPTQSWCYTKPMHCMTDSLRGEVSKNAGAIAAS